MGFHVSAQRFIADEYKKRFDPNLSLEITAYPGLNEQRVGVKAALAAQSHAPDIIAVEPGAYAVDVYTSGSVISGHMKNDRPRSHHTGRPTKMA